MQSPEDTDVKAPERPAEPAYVPTSISGFEGRQFRGRHSVGGYGEILDRIEDLDDH